MDISLVTKTLTARSMQKTDIFAGYSFPCKNKDKLDGLFILYMLHSKTESTVILQLPGERNNKSDFFPKIWQIFKVYLYSSTARDHCASLHRFQPKTKVVKCMQSMRTILQAVSSFACNHLAMWQISTQKMCVTLWNS